MRTGAGEDVVFEINPNTAAATEPEHISSAVRGGGRDCLERSQMSRNQVLGIHMPLLQASCTLGRELVGLTSRNKHLRN